MGHFLLSAAQKAVVKAAVAARANAKAYEQLAAPLFPPSGELDQNVYSTRVDAVESGNSGDERVVRWWNARWAKSCEELMVQT